jgi:hypothetical protein
MEVLVVVDPTVKLPKTFAMPPTVKFSETPMDVDPMPCVLRMLLLPNNLRFAIVKRTAYGGAEHIDLTTKAYFE